VRTRRGRRHRQLLDERKEKADTGYWILKEEALHRTQWRSRFERGYGPLVGRSIE